MIMNEMGIKEESSSCSGSQTNNDKDKFIRLQVIVDCYIWMVIIILEFESSHVQRVSII
uniref:Uncharacterized protein n=1 Tax=Helianthus annuus TaxID=4232 RepID=A0A251V3D7_HELAN